MDKDGVFFETDLEAEIWNELEELIDTTFCGNISLFYVLLCSQN